MNLTKSKLQFGVAPKEEQLGKDDEYQESIHPISEKLCGLSFLFQNILCSNRTSMAENHFFCGVWTPRTTDSSFLDVYKGDEKNPSTKGVCTLQGNIGNCGIVEGSLDVKV